jgi:hypothetical protein
VSLRDVGFFLRARLSRTIARAVNRKAPPPAPVAPLQDVLRGPTTPLALTRLLEGRDNAARQAAVARWLETHGVPFRRHRFATFEGAGENFTVDVGGTDQALVLIAHHDAVPKSPGANDNAAAVAILLTLLERWARHPPRRSVRLLFSACEELGYLGSRAWVREHGAGGVRGVLSLELPGIGDSLAIWDAGEPSPFLRTVCGTLQAMGLRADEGHHVVGRIPVFGSDHRAFAEAGVPAYGVTSVPAAEAAALRQFVFHPLRAAVRASVRRPPPFDTYHTARDTGATLEAAALDRMAAALAAVADAG